MSPSSVYLKFPRSWILQNEKRFAGCRSWIDLPVPSGNENATVVDDSAHKILAHIRQIVRAEEFDPASQR